MAILDSRLVLPLSVFGAGLALALLGGRKVAATTPATKPDTQPTQPTDEEMQFLLDQMQSVIARATAKDPTLSTSDIRALADTFERANRRPEAMRLRSIADEIDKERAQAGGGTPDQPPTPPPPPASPFVPDPTICRPGMAQLPIGTVSVINAMTTPGNPAFRAAELERMAMQLEHCAGGSGAYATQIAALRARARGELATQAVVGRYLERLPPRSSPATWARPYTAARWYW